MKPIKMLTAIGFGALVAAPAMAATTNATSITTYTDGVPTTFAASDAGAVQTENRNNPYNALGAPDSTASDNSFYSVGLGQMVDFRFGQTFTGPGTVYEITYGDRTNYLETADLSVSDDGTTFTDIGSVNNQDSGAISFSFNGSWSVLRLTDTSSNPPSEDGFDVDAIGVSAVPVPASALLLGGGLAGLAGLRKKRRTA